MEYLLNEEKSAIIYWLQGFSHSGVMALSTWLHSDYQELAFYCSIK